MKSIILDRDGVINYDSPHYIKSPDEWHPIPGSLEAIAALNRVGYHVFVITNQSGVARGLYDLEILTLIHEKFLHGLASVGGYIDEIFVCPHHPDEKCICRKPQPGLFFELKERYAIDLSQTYFVGDSLSDLEVSYRAGVKPILVRTGNGEKTLKDSNFPALSKQQTILVFDNLEKTAQFILER